MAGQYRNNICLYKMPTSRLFIGAKLKNHDPCKIWKVSNWTTQYVPTFIAQSFDGMLYHLLVAVQNELNFSFTLVESYGKFGTKLGNGYWSGQIGAVQRREIDISIMDLTVMYERAQVILPLEEKGHLFWHELCLTNLVELE